MLNNQILPSPSSNIIEYPLPKMPKLYKMRKSIKQKKQDAEDYRPHPKDAKKMGIYLNNDPVAKGYWDISEIKIYYQFLLSHKQEFQTQSVIAKRKLFNLLSKTLPNRTLEQCRSHHNLLFKKCGNNINNIIKNVQQKIETKSQKIKQWTLNIGHQQLKVQNSFGTTISSYKNMDEQTGLVIYIDELVIW